MPKIIFNYKICDKAPECGGISECPVGAITYDQSTKKPVWDESKCTYCLKCTLPNACPVGAILFAKDDNQERTILDTINSDSRSEQWLWQERYGVQPASTPPLALLLSPENYDTVMKTTDPIVVDIWHEDFIDCRLHSPLFSDLLKNIPDLQIYKLDAKKFPKLAKSLNISHFPALLLLKNGEPIFVYTGYINATDILDINSKLTKLLIKSK